MVATACFLCRGHVPGSFCPKAHGTQDVPWLPADMRSMSTQGLDRKKRIEKDYLEEARRACSIFPKGELVPSERPDFLLHADSGIIGIEVTELCREEPRAQAGRLAKVVENAKKRYSRLPTAKPVDVVVGFSIEAEKARSKVLIDTLVRFVQTHGKSKVSRFPEGYCYIGVHSPLEPTGRWRDVRAFDTTVAPEQLLNSRIVEKNGRVADYRRLAASAVWLLIVNDQWLGPGEVYARPEDIVRWKFDFDFEKVLLFSREPGGHGEVFELQRT